MHDPTTLSTEALTAEVERMFGQLGRGWEARNQGLYLAPTYKQMQDMRAYLDSLLKELAQRDAAARKGL